MADTPKFDIYQSITDQIIAAIEAGAQTDGKPLWVGQGAANAMPFNRISRRAYHGVNVLVLWLTANARGYGSSAWLTFRQAAELGGSVRKGEKATHIVYYKTLEREQIDPATGEAEARSIPMLRSYAIFNADQCEGLPALPSDQRHDFDPIDAADHLLRASGAVIIEQGAKAAYAPRIDTIRLPDRNRFARASGFYNVALHELTHWTGHKSRLARDFSGRFGSEAYAFEELIAELGSAFLCAELGLVPETLPDHASYVDSWLRVLRKDKRAIFTAASQASKAHEFLTHRANPDQQIAA